MQRPPNGGPASQKHYDAHYQDAAYHLAGPQDWPLEEEAPWFFAELSHELPLLLGAAVRMILRINCCYWSHVWIFVAGWRTALSALKNCEEQGPQVKYCFGATVTFLLFAWQRGIVSEKAPFIFVIFSSPWPYAFAAATVRSRRLSPLFPLFLLFVPPDASCLRDHKNQVEEAALVKRADIEAYP